MSRGKQVGNFVIGERIGQGAFCNVYYCRERLSSSFDFAVKVVNKAKLSLLNMTDAFEREVESMRRIKASINVVNLIAVLQSSRNYYLVMDLADGGTLLDRVVQQQRLNSRTARKYIRQLLQGLNAVHNSGVVHRDIKPENLLLDARDVLKISDFTFACISPEGRVLQRQCGTPHYVAPEVLFAEGYCGRKADVWSAGVCLYVMLVGRLPFVAQENPVLYELIRRGEYEVPYTVPPAACDLLSRMLVMDPALRWSVQQLLVHPWVLGIEGSTYSKMSAKAMRCTVVDVAVPMCTSRSCPELMGHMAVRTPHTGATPAMRMTPVVTPMTPPTSIGRAYQYANLLPSLLRFLMLCISLGFWTMLAIFFDVRRIPQRFVNGMSRAGQKVKVA